MNTKTAILALAQSEKIKTGLIWMSQAVEQINGLPPHERKGAEKTIKIALRLVVSEIRIARRITQEAAWDDIEVHMDMAGVMIDSGVCHESAFHMTRALSQITTIGRRCMQFLQKKGLLR